MAKKSLYHEKHYTYTDDANQLDLEASNLVRPLFKKYVDLGYSPREIAQIIAVAAHMEECEILLEMGSKRAKRTTLKHVAKHIVR